MKRGLPDDAFDRQADDRHLQLRIGSGAVQPTPRRVWPSFVKRGVWESGGVPLEFPVTSLGEAQIQPTAMLLRNLMAMDVEESIRGNPVDGVVLLAGCDKTTPAMVMGAASVDLPAIMLTGGPMLSGRHLGQRLGSATDVWRMSEQVRAGIAQRRGVPGNRVGDDAQRRSLQPDGYGVDDGFDGGSARTDACPTTRPFPRPTPAGGGSPTSPDGASSRWWRPTSDRPRCSPGRRSRTRSACSRRSADRATPSSISWRSPVGSVSSSTLDDFDRIGSRLPLLANVMPAGEYLMEDFFEAGGIPAVMAELADLLDGEAMTVSGAADP